jgi:hypothetical protein
VDVDRIHAAVVGVFAVKVKPAIAILGGKASDGFADAPALGVVGVALAPCPDEPAQGVVFVVDALAAGACVAAVFDAAAAAAFDEFAVAVPQVDGLEAAAFADFAQLLGGVDGVDALDAGADVAGAVAQEVVDVGFVDEAVAVAGAGAQLGVGEPGQGVEAVLPVPGAEAADFFAVAGATAEAVVLGQRDSWTFLPSNEIP